jgi:hypothetical protein
VYVLQAREDTDFDDGVSVRSFIPPTTAAINKKNDRLLKKIADVTTKRGLPGGAQPDYRTSQPTGNRLTWVPC